MAEFKPGDHFTVTVGGVEYDTEIDERGVQRFVENPDYPLVKEIKMVWDTYLNCDIRDMNTMMQRYINGEFSKREYAEMNIFIGYSVCGFADLSTFHDMEINNPVWDD